MATEVEDFLDDVLPQQLAAERAIHNGDAEPRSALRSHRDPVTLFGAVLSGSGWDELDAAFKAVASWFSDSAEYDVEIVAAGASGDLAYTVGFEHNNVKVDGQQRTYTLRVTHVYRREDGRWKIVHRHADSPPAKAEGGPLSALDEPRS
jgi:ketosteroid isomerase-like protein